MAWGRCIGSPFFPCYNLFLWLVSYFVSELASWILIVVSVMLKDQKWKFLFQFLFLLLIYVFQLFGANMVLCGLLINFFAHCFFVITGLFAFIFLGFWKEGVFFFFFLHWCQGPAEISWHPRLGMEWNLGLAFLIKLHESWKWVNEFDGKN